MQVGTNSEKVWSFEVLSFEVSLELGDLQDFRSRKIEDLS
jgi:hypothetical protein